MLTYQHALIQRALLFKSKEYDTLRQFVIFAVHFHFHVLGVHITSHDFKAFCSCAMLISLLTNVQIKQVSLYEFLKSVTALKY